MVWSKSMLNKNVSLLLFIGNFEHVDTIILDETYVYDKSL